MGKLSIQRLKENNTTTCHVYLVTSLTKQYSLAGSCVFKWLRNTQYIVGSLLTCTILYICNYNGTLRAVISACNDPLPRWTLSDGVGVRGYLPCACLFPWFPVVRGYPVHACFHEKMLFPVCSSSCSVNQIRFPDSDSNHSFCRNPSGQWERPWCYSDNPDVDWEFCDVPLCGNDNLFIYLRTYLYRVDS